MTRKSFHVYTDKKITPRELAEMFLAVGWHAREENEPFSPETLALVGRSLNASSFVAYARDNSGEVIGYLSALSDGAFSAFIDMVLVRPSYQRLGVGKALMQAAEEHFSGVPMYAMPFMDMHEFFLKQGYKIQKKRPMQALSKRN